MDEPIESDDGSMIWDYLPGLEVVAENVWTVIEGVDGEVHVQAGVEKTNEFGYAVTLKPWIAGDEASVWRSREAASIGRGILSVTARPSSVAS